MIHARRSTERRSRRHHRILDNGVEIGSATVDRKSGTGADPERAAAGEQRAHLYRRSDRSRRQ